MLGDAFNEGVGHGGIVVNMVGAPAQQGVVIDPFNVDRETMILLRPDQFGSTIVGTGGAKAGRLKNINATGTAQLPTTNGGTVPQPIIEGQQFTDPNTGFNWWVAKVNEAYQSGQFWKQECEFEQRLN